MRSLQAALSVVSALGVLAAPAAAQRIDSPYRFVDTSQLVSVYGGYTSASDGRLGMGPASAPTFGARWAMRVSGPFALGVEIGFMPSTRTVRDTVLQADSMFRAIGEADMNVLTLLGNVRLNLTGPRTWNRLQPFGIIGVGAALDLGGAAAVEEDLASEARFDFGTSFAGQLGAGVEWFPAQRLSLRVDGRNLLWKLRVPDAMRQTQFGRSLPSSEWEQNFVLSAGLSIHF